MHMCCIVLFKLAFFVVVCVLGSQFFVMVVVFLPLLKSGSSLQKASLDTDVVSIEASAPPMFTVPQPSI